MLLVARSGPRSRVPICIMPLPDRWPCRRGSLQVRRGTRACQCQSWYPEPGWRPPAASLCLQYPYISDSAPCDDDEGGQGQDPSGVGTGTSEYQCLLLATKYRHRYSTYQRAPRKGSWDAVLCNSVTATTAYTIAGGGKLRQRQIPPVPCKVPTLSPIAKL